MKSLSIKIDTYFEFRSDMINGLIGRLLMQDIHPDGLEEIALSKFDENVGDLN